MVLKAGGGEEGVVAQLHLETSSEIWNDHAGREEDDDDGHPQG
jgi:hypothetical protein